VGESPVVKIELKRADAAELVRADPFLAGCELARALQGRLGEVLAQAVVRRYPDRMVVYQQNDSGHSLYLVLAGEVRLLGRKLADGVELGSATRGQVLGEGEALLGAATRRTSAVAHGVADLAEVPRAALLVDGRLPAALQRFLERVGQERARTLDEMTDFLDRW
jgi:CRP-like cAMP-binding protein